MDRGQAKAKLRDICADIQNMRADKQSKISSIIIDNWREDKAEEQLYDTIGKQVLCLLDESYDGKRFYTEAADLGVTLILICSGLLDALKAERRNKDYGTENKK